MTGLQVAMDRFERAREAFADVAREVQGIFANPLPKEDSCWPLVKRLLEGPDHVAGTLVVYPNRDHARRDGFPVTNVLFRGNLRIEAWWPDAGIGRIVSRRFQVVILMAKADPLLSPEARATIQRAVDAFGRRGKVEFH